MGENDRCWHAALLQAMDARLREALGVRSEVDCVVECPWCGTPCRVWLYHIDDYPVLMIHEQVDYGEMDHYSWTGTEWWED